jgi:hypothetical protein
MVRKAALMACLLLALSAAPAMAFAGIYSPGVTQPSSVVHLREQQAYFKRLGVRVTKAQLRRGSFRDGLGPLRAAAPSRRAGLSAGSLGLAPLIVVGALGLAFAALAARRRAASPVH